MARPNLTENGGTVYTGGSRKGAWLEREREEGEGGVIPSIPILRAELTVEGVGRPLAADLS
jgi:hypothetical protein